MLHVQFDRFPFPDNVSQDCVHQGGLSIWFFYFDCFVNHGKIRHAHKEHLIESDAEIVNGTNPERARILDKLRYDPIKNIKITQNTIDDLHDKGPVTAIKGLGELVKGLFWFSFFLQDIAQAGNGRNSRLFHVADQ